MATTAGSQDAVATERAQTDGESSGLHTTVLIIGSCILGIVVAGGVLYLAIFLCRRKLVKRLHPKDKQRGSEAGEDAELTDLTAAGGTSDGSAPVTTTVRENTVSQDCHLIRSQPQLPEQTIMTAMPELRPAVSARQPGNELLPAANYHANNLSFEASSTNLLDLQQQHSTGAGARENRFNQSDPASRSRNGHGSAAAASQHLEGLLKQVDTMRLMIMRIMEEQSPVASRSWATDAASNGRSNFEDARGFEPDLAETGAKRLAAHAPQETPGSGGSDDDGGGSELPRQPHDAADQESTAPAVLAEHNATRPRMPIVPAAAAAVLEVGAIVSQVDSGIGGALYSPAISPASAAADTIASSDRTPPGSRTAATISSRPTRGQGSGSPREHLEHRITDLKFPRGGVPAQGRCVGVPEDPPPSYRSSDAQPQPGR